MLLLVIGIVAVACNFISFAELDSGTKRTFDWMSERIKSMSQESYIGEKETYFETYPVGFIKEGLAIVWFDMGQEEIDIAGTNVKRPLECELNLGCLAVCSVDSIDKDSCSRSKLLGKAIFLNPILDYKGDGKKFEGPKEGQITISKDKETKKLSIDFLEQS